MVFVGDEVESVSVGVVVSDKSLAERPEFVRRFLRGTLRAFRWFKNNEKAAVARLAKGMKVADEDALDVFKATLRVYSNDGTITRSAQDDMSAFWKKGLKIDKDIPADAVFDFRVVNALNKELGKGSSPRPPRDLPFDRFTNHHDWAPDNRRPETRRADNN